YNPSKDGVFHIELSNLSSDNAAVFVYKSCDDIGDECFAGTVSDGTSNAFDIDKVLLHNDQDYYIVVSTKTSAHTNYTLTIDEAQLNCADYTDAPDGDKHQYSQPGFTLADLDVKGANLTWYNSASLDSIAQ